MPAKNYAVVAIPLNRPAIVDFLLERSPIPRGAPVELVGLRPAVAATLAWREKLQTLARPTIDDLLAIDQPHTYLTHSHTDRLVPVEFLAEHQFLTRNLGGWSPVYFGVIDLQTAAVNGADPLLAHAQILTEFGPEIRYYGADPALVAERLEAELEADLPTVIAAQAQLLAMRRRYGANRLAMIEQLNHLLLGLAEPTRPAGPPIPPLLLLDELLDLLVAVELERRQALANGQILQAEAIAAHQQRWHREYDLTFILKGEYIAGRHRSSLVLIAPQLGLVVKQPAPEPFHEIELNARSYHGLAENWPYSTADGSLVTPRGRLRLVIEEAIVPRLSQVLGHRIDLSTAVGLSVEAFVAGQTVQQLVLDDPRRMTLELYQEFMLRQQVCELLGGENGDWHAANFVVKPDNGALVHIDWGAARPLRPNEYTPESKLARINQVRNIAYSFHDDALARRVMQLHAEFMAEPGHLAQVRQRAQKLIEAAGL